MLNPDSNRGNGSCGRGSLVLSRVYSGTQKLLHCGTMPNCKLAMTYLEADEMRRRIFCCHIKHEMFVF